MRYFPDSTSELRNLLVQEFRACQDIFAHLHQLQVAIIRRNPAQIMRMTATIETRLQHLSQLTKTRKQLSEKLQISFRQSTKEARKKFPKTSRQARDSLTSTTNVIAFTQSATHLENNASIQIQQIFVGIEILRNQIRQTIRCNTDLASQALEHSNLLQSRLEHLYTAPPVPIKNHPLTQNTFPAMLATILATRDAMNSGDRTAISAALGDLQDFLRRLDLSLETNSTITNTTTQPPAAGTSSETTLIEKIADLYRCSTAYQEVLQTSRRMLAQA